jgi:Fe2+ transport system protein FeoA
VRVEHVAPFGDPIAYRLHGYRLALRRREACRVRIEGRAS